jgi:hypothetical protein
MHQAMGKQKKPWLTGAITVLIVTTIGVALVVTIKTFNKPVNKNDCDKDLACHLRPWWEPTHQRAVTATFSTPVSIESSPRIEIGRTHPGLAKRAIDDILVGEIGSTVDDNELEQVSDQAGGTNAQNVNQVQEDDKSATGSQEVDNAPILEDEQTKDNYIEEVSDREENTEEETNIQEEEIKPEDLKINADFESMELEALHACFVNGDCGSGYQCFKGQCRPGCSNDLDCPKGYECRYGRYGHRCFQRKGWHRECKVHLRFCFRHSQCCSGYCSRRFKGQALMCRRKPDDVEVEEGATGQLAGR